MPQQNRLQSGALENVPTKEEKDLKDKYKGKKAKDLSTADIQELVLEIAKLLKIL